MQIWAHQQPAVVNRNPAVGQEARTRDIKMPVYTSESWLCPPWRPQHHGFFLPSVHGPCPGTTAWPRDCSQTIRTGTEQGRVPTARLDLEVNEELPKKRKDTQIPRLLKTVRLPHQSNKCKVKQQCSLFSYQLSKNFLNFKFFYLKKIIALAGEQWQGGPQNC